MALGTAPQEFEQRVTEFFGKIRAGKQEGSIGVALAVSSAGRPSE